MIFFSFVPDSCSCHARLVYGPASRLGGQNLAPRCRSVAPIQFYHCRRLSLRVARSLKTRPNSCRNDKPFHSNSRLSLRGNLCDNLTMSFYERHHLCAHALRLHLAGFVQICLNGVRGSLIVCSYSASDSRSFVTRYCLVYLHFLSWWREHLLPNEHSIQHNVLRKMSEAPT